MPRQPKLSQPHRRARIARGAMYEAWLGCRLKLGELR